MMLKSGSQLLAIFPIENVVFFPKTTVMLHIFEPRYQQLMVDIQENDFNKFVLTSFKENQPSLVGVVAKLIYQKTLSDGRSNIIVHGLERVKIHEYFRPFSYNHLDYAIAEVQSYPEVNKIYKETWNSLKLQLYHKFKLYFENNTDQLFNLRKDQIDSFSPQEAINSACYFIQLDPHIKQQLLEENSLINRVKKLLEFLSKINT